MRSRIVRTDRNQQRDGQRNTVMGGGMAGRGPGGRAVVVLGAVAVVVVLVVEAVVVLVGQVVAAGRYNLTFSELPTIF